MKPRNAFLSNKMKKRINFSLRLTPESHKELVKAARKKGTSLQQEIHCRLFNEAEDIKTIVRDTIKEAFRHTRVSVEEVDLGYPIGNLGNGRQL